jgi:hypothetical protein
VHPKIEILIHFFNYDIEPYYKDGSLLAVHAKNTITTGGVDLAQANMANKTDMNVFIATVSKLYNRKIKKMIEEEIGQKFKNT